MIVVDSSAVVALALDEPESDEIARIIATNRSLIAAPTALESHLVLSGRSPASANAFMDTFLAREAVELVPFDRALLQLARRAFDEFGRGRHPAALNFGDCFAYALAKAQNAPLLYKGDDFSRTDIRSVFRQGPK
jgi:ribonuclease VapC